MSWRSEWASLSGIDEGDALYNRSLHNLERKGAMQDLNTFGKLVGEIVKASFTHPTQETHITIERGGHIRTETLARTSTPPGQRYPLASVSKALHRLYTHAFAH
jgi:hypothetical protein